MPAGSEPTPVRLPHTFRPLGVRIAIFLLGGLLLLVCAVAWFSFPPHIRAEFTFFERLTVLAIGAGFYAIGYALARSRVVARDSGLTLVNGFRVHRYDWNQVVRVSLRPGSPWAELDLSDGTSMAALGIQSSDGARGYRQAAQLRALVETLTRPERDE